tara:strand:- start:1991 stop:2125 length:135 start_codon:yes stop_codon:yes gene_type:complete
MLFIYACNSYAKKMKAKKVLLAIKQKLILTLSTTSVLFRIYLFA